MQAEVIHSSARGMIELVHGEETFIRRTVYSENTVYNALKFHKSPYLPKIYSVEVSGGKTVVCEEYIEGKSPVCSELSAKEAENIMVQLCSALEAIHRLGIVHRDVKPSNILLCGDGSIRLIDFEAARIFKDDSDNDTCYLGTRGYAPPEQYGFAQTDFRADIYAAGQTMKVLLGGLAEKPLYKGIIGCCTELDPRKRYRDASELKKAILNIRRKAVLLPIFSAVAVLALGICIFVGIRSANGEPAYAETESELPQTVTASSVITEAAQTTAKAAESETERLVETETAVAETVLDTETSANETQTSANMTEITTASGVIYGNEISYPDFSEEKITYATDPENIPEYSDDDMIFFCEDKNAKILLAGGKGLYGKFEKYLMQTDLDGDGLVEMATVCVDINGRLDIEIYTGKIVDGNQLGVFCYDFIVPIEFDEELLGKDTFVQLTEFELDGDRLLAVTIGDKESYNFTGFFTVIDDQPTFIGSAWGETYARVVGTSLSEYFRGGGSNLYSYSNGKLKAVTAYDYAEYSSVNYAPAPLEDIYDFYS